MKLSILIFSLLSSLNVFADAPSQDDLSEACEKAYEFNKEGNIPAAYNEFAKIGDTYAVAATKIFDTSRVTMERCVIQAHWLNVVGADEKDKYFDKYGKRYQHNYIDLVCKNKKLPKTDQIEKLYGDTLKDMDLPDSLSIDKVLNRQDRNSKFRILQNVSTHVLNGEISFDEKMLKGEWYDAINIDSSRISKHQYKANISANKADNVAFMTSMLTVPVCVELFGEKALNDMIWAGKTFSTVNVAQTVLSKGFLQKIGDVMLPDCKD